MESRDWRISGARNRQVEEMWGTPNVPLQPPQASALCCRGSQGTHRHIYVYLPHTQTCQKGVRVELKKLPSKHPLSVHCNTGFLVLLKEIPDGNAKGSPVSYQQEYEGTFYVFCSHSGSTVNYFHTRKLSLPELRGQVKGTVGRKEAEVSSVVDFN